MRRSTALWPLFALPGALVCLASCKVGPDYETPAAAVPPVFAEASASPEGALALEPAVLAAWWDHFADQSLSAMIRVAVEASPSLTVASGRLREARARYVAAVGELWPRVDANARYERARSSRETQAPSFSGTRELFAPGFDMSWELDIFGAERRGAEAARASAAAEQFAYEDVLVSLLADVGESYIATRRLEEELRIAAANLDAQSATLAAVRVRVREGLTAELDLRRAETNVFTTEASIPVIKANLAARKARLATLLGRDREAVDALLEPSGALPKTPLAVAVGVPADLLAWRPDIRAAEQRLAASVARIGEAEAALFPSVSFAASAVLESHDLDRLVQMSAMNWSFGPSIRFPLFQRDRLRALVEAADAQAQQAFATYRQTILLAVEEVEAQLANFREERTRREALGRAVEAAREGVRQARVAYDQGLTAFQTVLDAERSKLDLERQVAVSDAQLGTSLIALFKGFGGGLAAASDDPAVRPAHLPWDAPISVSTGMRSTPGAPHD